MMTFKGFSFLIIIFLFSLFFYSGDLFSAVKKEETPALKKPHVKEAISEKKTATEVTGIKIDKEKGLRVIISGRGEMRYNVFLLKTNRLVIDILDAINKARPMAYTVSDPSLSRVRIGEHKEPKKVRVVLELTRPFPYEITKDGSQLIVNLKTAKPPEKRRVVRKKLPRVKEPIAKVEKPLPPKKVTEKKKEPAPKVEAPPKKKVIEAIKEKIVEKPKTKRPLPSKKEDLLAKEIPKYKYPREVEEEKEELPPHLPIIQKPPEIPEASVTGKYTGRKISLDFEDADILSILRLISEVSGINIIASPEVKGKVTVKMLNVPWDQALDIILKTHGMGKVFEDNIIRVVPLTALTKERDDLAKAKEAEAKAEDLVSKIIPLGYSKPGPMKDAIEKAKVLSPRGNVSIDERTNTLIVKDIAKNLAEAESLIKVLDKPTPQVSIEAKIVEASTSFIRELGIQWGFKNIADAAHGNPLPYTFPHSMKIGGSTLTGGTGMSGNPWAINLPAPVGVGSGGALGLTFGSITNTFTLDLQLSALEGIGQGKILSNPKIITLDNEEALIKQGRSIPYITVSAEGTQTIFREAVISLTVTPTITPGGAISIKLLVTKDEPGAEVAAGTIIERREAKTNVLVQDGETIVIGGIITSKKTGGMSGVPLLHKIPILGWLFKKETLREETSELLIFITPRIVRPA